MRTNVNSLKMVWKLEKAWTWPALLSCSDRPGSRFATSHTWRSSLLLSHYPEAGSRMEFPVGLFV